MTDQTGDTGEIAVADDSEISLTDARAMLDAQFEKENPEGADDATPKELSDEGNAARPEKDATGEDQEADPAEKPPLDLPRSWTKDRAEYWNKLDPDTQAFLLEQDSKASAEVRRVQNKAAEAEKAAEAKAAQVEQARQHYEAKTKAALEVLEREQLRDFPDIKTMADVAKMAMEDPFRKIQWDVHQDQLRAAAWEAQQAEQRKSQEHQTEWANLVQTENAKAAELIPDLADKVKGPALMKRAAERLTELGFNDQELSDLANGKSKLPVYDHRIQQLIFDSLKLADIQNAPKAVAAKPVPQVQRPGVARPSNAGDSEAIQALDKRLSQTGSEKDAWALFEARQRAQTRRAS